MRIALALLLVGCGATAPAVERPGDADEDGIDDLADACPDQAEDLDQFHDEDGCPDPDNDGDGIADVDDMCPCAVEDMDAFEDGDGCPDLDNDQDRIADACDQCPNDPELYNGFSDADGCPDQALIRVQANEIRIVERVRFERGSAQVPAASMPLLDEVARVMIDHPEIRLLALEGHTDVRERSRTLAQRRAEAVRDVLVGRGVPAERLEARAIGSNQPLDGGRSEEAYARNRRVEFRILQVDQPPPPEPEPPLPAECTDPPPAPDACAD